MRIRRYKLTWSLVNSQAYAQAYINRPIQPLSTTLGLLSCGVQLGKRTSLTYQDSCGEQLGFQDQDRDSLPPSATQPPARRLHPCRSQQPFYVLNYVSLRVRLPQAFHAPTRDLVAKGGASVPQRFTAQPNAHLHGGIGVIYKH